MSVSNTSFKNTGRHIVVETVANDYCSCSSLVKFDEKRGEKLKDAEFDPSKKPGAFVTYHFSTLKKALQARILKEAPHFRHLKPLGRKVEYRQKDVNWNVGESFHYAEDGLCCTNGLTVRVPLSPDRLIPRLL